MNVGRLRRIRQITVQPVWLRKNEGTFGWSLKLRSSKGIRDKYGSTPPRRVFRLSAHRFSVHVVIAYQRPMAQKVPGVWYFPRKPRPA